MGGGGDEQGGRLQQVSHRPRALPAGRENVAAEGMG